MQPVDSRLRECIAEGEIVYREVGLGDEIQIRFISPGVQQIHTGDFGITTLRSPRFEDILMPGVSP